MVDQFSYLLVTSDPIVSNLITSHIESRERRPRVGVGKSDDVCEDSALLFDSAEETHDTDVTSDAAPTSDPSAAESTSVDSDSSSDSSADITTHDPTVFANQEDFYELPDYYFEK